MNNTYIMKLTVPGTDISHKEEITTNDLEYIVRRARKIVFNSETYKYYAGLVQSEYTKSKLKLKPINKVLFSVKTIGNTISVTCNIWDTEE